MNNISRAIIKLVALFYIPYDIYRERKKLNNEITNVILLYNNEIFIINNKIRKINKSINI